VLLPFLLLLVLVIWGLIDGDVYFKEAAIYGVLLLACLAVVLFVPNYGIAGLVPICFVDVYLLIKLVGNPSVT